MNKIKFNRWVVAGALVFGAVSASHATTLDFTVFPPGAQGTTTLVLPEATVTGFADDLFVGDTVPNSICSLTSAFNCQGDLEIDFVNLVSNLVFDANGFGTGDFVAVTAYDSANVAIGSININAGGSYGFGPLGGISRIFFDDSSTAAGLSFANITFDQQDVGVPEPNSLPLLLLGIAGLGLVFMRRRRVADRPE